MSYTDLLPLRPVIDHETANSREDVVLQLFDVDVRSTAAPALDISDPSLLFRDTTYNSFDEDVAEARKYEKVGPGVVYVFGVTEQGHSVTLAVSNFKPWIHIEVNDTVTPTLIDLMVHELSNKFGTRDDRNKVVMKCPIELDYVPRKRAYGWVPASLTDTENVREFTYAQIKFPTVACMRAALFAFQNRSLQCLSRSTTLQVDIADAKTLVSEKFLAQAGLQASGWVRVKANMYNHVPLTERVTVSQLELKCSMAAMEAVPIDRIAPIVIAAVDIEVQSGDFRSFPDASDDINPCTYIGTTFWVYGDKQPRERVMQVLGSCSPVPNMRVESYQTEYELLTAWRDLIAVRANPEKIISYNGTGFDYAYMAKRFSRVKSMSYSRFNHFGRFLYESKPLHSSEMSSAAMGQNEVSSFPMSGRWQMDLFHYVKINYKLSSYGLDDVCKHFLGAAAQDSAGVTGGKVVLDYPGWVTQLTEAALEALRRFVLTVDPGETDEQLQRCVREIHVALQLSHTPLDEEALGGGAEADVVVVEEEDEEGSASKHAAADDHGQWLHVHSKMESAMDVLGKWLQSHQEHMATATTLLDTVIQPALDASGADNYRKLFRMYVAGPEHRGCIAAYCQVDCDLVLYLLDRISVVPNTVQMSQVCNTLLNDIANRGQQIKTFNLIARHAHRKNYVMNVRDVGWDPEENYEGATVLPPTPGYYQTPVATLDFASLYPSIMQAYNLCFSSIVLDDEYKNLEAHGARYSRYEIGSKTWVFQEHKKGLLPEILADLLAARRACKKEMAKYDKNSLDYKLADGKQLALKISCNSVYGFCGVLNNAMYSCMPVAVATTYNGRNLIQQTKKYVEDNFGCTVVYGDTDSVMIQFPGITTVHEAFPLAARAASEVTNFLRTKTSLPGFVKLEFEKVYLPYLLIKKKHYAGMKYEGEPDDPPYLDAKGLAVVRRDNCQLVRTTMKEVLHACMRDNDPLRAYQIVKQTVDRLIARQVPVKDLQVSNFLRKDLKDDHHPHIQVVKNMEARHAFGIPRCGDRVPYCILEGKKDSKIYERAEHPKYIEEHNLRIDLAYYLQNQLQKRLEKVLKPLPIPDVDLMFSRAAAAIMRDREGLQQLSSFACFAQFVPSQSLPPPRAPAPPPAPVVKRTQTQLRLDGSVATDVKKARKAGKQAEATKQMPLTAFFK